MVGGGEGAFIGAVHRWLRGLDNTLDLVCGAFASDAERSRRSGASLGLPPDRCYADFDSMFAAEARSWRSRQAHGIRRDRHAERFAPRRRDGRVPHGSTCSPTSLRREPSPSASSCAMRRRRAAASTASRTRTARIRSIVEAAERVRAGQLGTVRKVIVEYTQGWLAEPIERRGQKQAIWRLDPKRAGLSSCMGDIGVHAFHLAEFVTNLRTTELCADLNSIVAGRELDDDGAAFLRFDNGARGVLVASQVCTGDENDLRLRVYGDAASLEWREQEPNSLWLKHAHKAIELIRSGATGLRRSGARAFTVALGPSRGLSRSIRERLPQLRGAGAGARRQRQPPHAPKAVPGIKAALRGIAFVETVVAASKSEKKWHAFPSTP